MDAGSFIVDVDNFFEGIITSGATAAFNALAVPSASFLTLLGAVAFAFFVTVNAMRGSFSLESFLNFFFRFGLIYSFVSGGALWASVALPFITGFASGVGGVILSSFGTEIENTSGVVSVLSNFVGGIFTTIKSAFGEIGFRTTLSGETFAIIVFGVISAIATLALGVISLAFIVISKFILAILIAITPVMALWVFLKSSADVFSGWVRGVTTILLFQILVYGVLGSIMAASQSVRQSASTAVGDGSELGNNLLLFALVSGLGSIALLACPIIARTVGGAALKFGENEVRDNLGKLTPTSPSPNGDPIGDASKEEGKATKEADKASPKASQEANTEKARQTSERNQRLIQKQ